VVAEIFAKTKLKTPVAVTEEHYADDHQRSLCIWWLAPAQDGGSQHAIRDAMMVTS